MSRPRLVLGLLALGIWCSLSSATVTTRGAISHGLAETEEDAMKCDKANHIYAAAQDDGHNSCDEVKSAAYLKLLEVYKNAFKLCKALKGTYKIGRSLPKDRDNATCDSFTLRYGKAEATVRSYALVFSPAYWAFGPRRNGYSYMAEEGYTCECKKKTAAADRETGGDALVRADGPEAAPHAGRSLNAKEAETATH